MSDREQENTSIQGVQCERETAKAIMVRIDGKAHWIPKSIIHDDSEVFGEGHFGELVVPDWFAEKEELA